MKGLSFPVATHPNYLFFILYSLQASSALATATAYPSSVPSSRVQSSHRRAMATPPPPPNTPTTRLGTTFTSDGLRRSHRIARLSLKHISERELDFNLIHLQGENEFQTITVQHLKDVIIQLYRTSPPAVEHLGTASFGMWTSVASAVAQFDQSHDILGTFRAQLFPILSKMAEALTTRIINTIVGWLWQVSRHWLAARSFTDLHEGISAGPDELVFMR